MNNLVLLSILGFLWVFVPNALALSDRDYEGLKSSSQEFSLADKKLGQTWKQVTQSLNETAKNAILKEQREWIRHGWDEDATRILMQGGITKEQAYTKAIENRISRLLAFNTPKNQTNPVASEKGTRITVEAEGIGETKMKALNSAWMEAVRKAVGMVMVGKQEAIDDALTEQIITHSRGQINSYKVLSENNSGGVWTVNILANIDQDILQETVGTSKTNVMTFDGTQEAAQKNMSEQKQASALEIVKEALAILKPEEWIECKSSIHKYTSKDGQKGFYASFLLYPNLKNYKILADQAEKLISKVATSVLDVKIDTERAKAALQLIKNPKLNPKLPPNGSIFNYTGDNSSPKLSVDLHGKSGICFFKNIGNLKCYSFEGTDVGAYLGRSRNIQQTFEVDFSAESGDDFEGMLGQDTKRFSYPPLSKFINNIYLFISPVVGQFDINKQIVTWQTNVPLKLTDEQLVNIKEIRGECKIIPLNK